ncbi:MAG TPA: hypothetical protein VFZ21_28580 [Gemmatimonadaceae bacterium]|nr:hypothetical protein [Gemmatimonadaceae bacterium]
MREAAAEERSPDRAKGGTPPVDVERLADRVYRLMLADVRLERARSGGADQPRTPE